MYSGTWGQHILETLKINSNLKFNHKIFKWKNTKNVNIKCFFSLFREGLKKIFMENSILGGGQRGSFSISNFLFFCSRWSKNHFKTLKFLSCMGGVPPWGSSSPPQASQTHTKVTKPSQGQFYHFWKVCLDFQW